MLRSLPASEHFNVSNALDGNHLNGYVASMKKYLGVGVVKENCTSHPGGHDGGDVDVAGPTVKDGLLDQEAIEESSTVAGPPVATESTTQKLNG